ncbi:Stigma-specific protein Stig1 [Macleaya cordata]|uniref:Stigma-specific protein Stig1 n=1 Tax=Macleaya cordata TaxID=56857 RepID=A0A200QB92_MACCD|nr:Stigma-specific protein Stig1 [Macleaya cordata]
MATTTPHVILSIMIISLLLFLHSSTAFNFEDSDIEDGEEYVVDNPFSGRFTARANRLEKQEQQKIEKGAKCDPFISNICNGVFVNNGTGLLRCCRKQCRNMLADRDNCGGCRKKCGYGQLCCYGACVDVAYNKNHCGKCGVQCLPGLKCEYGTCGYA